MGRPAFIGIDWGNTHRRAMLLAADGSLLAQHADGQGMLACEGRFGPALQALLQIWPEAHEVPVVMAGAIGSINGWQEVPYVDARTPLRDLPAHLVPLRDEAFRGRCRLVPGVCLEGEGGQVDVMRGEETQLLGALELLGDAASDGWYLLPGTHSKWVRLEQGAVVAQRTYMSGELFALLRDRGSLAAWMQDASGWDDAVFERAADELSDDALSQALFTVRARVAAHRMPGSDVPACVSGVLLGAEWRDLQRHGRPDGAVRLIGEPALVRLHTLCARRAGVAVQALDVQQVQLKAWQALMKPR
jgi:2-dehydro-3-deoxygalactonokinase